MLYIANYNSIIHSIRKNERISGYCLFKFSLNDLENFDNLISLLPNNPTVKQTLKRYNQDLKILIDLGKTILFPSESTNLDVTLTYPKNSWTLPKVDENILAEVLLQIISPTQQTLWRKKKFAKIKKDLSELYSADISASTSIGTHVLTGKLLLNKTVITETNKSFFVAPPINKAECPIEIIDPENIYTKQCLTLTEKVHPLAPIIILPPFANTIFGYPDNEFTMLLTSVKEGAIGIIFSPPKDWNQLKRLFSDYPEIQMESLENYPNATVFHYVKPHPIFLNLPSRQLMRLPYRKIIGKKFFLNKSDEDATGIILFPNSTDSKVIWGTTILILRYGVGRLVFTTLRIFENLEYDPIAQHIFINLLNHLSRRAIAPEKPPLPIQHAVEFMRYKKNTTIRKWTVFGPFPPQVEIEKITLILDKLLKREENLPTIFGPLPSKIWFTLESEHHNLNFYDAFDIPTYNYHLEETPLSGIAYGEFNSPQKCEAILQVKTPNHIQVWLNDTLVIENLSEQTEVKTYEAKVLLKNSKNWILLWCSKKKGPLNFQIELLDLNRKKLNLSWIN